MKISVFGLGYVGCVSASCLANEGHDVLGVDINSVKVDLINSGRTPIIEKDMLEIVSRNVKEGRLRAITDSAEAIASTDISLICVGTPSRPNGSLDLGFVEKVCEKIGRCILTVPCQLK